MPLTTITISKLDRIAVRTSLVNPADPAPCQDGCNKGSGLLIGTKRKWYVLTAKHCVRDKKKEEILVQLKNEDGTTKTEMMDVEDIFIIQRFIQTIENRALEKNWLIML